MKVNCIIGIDPGVDGGICIYIPNEKIRTIKMEADLTDLAPLFKWAKEKYNPLVFIEKIGMRPSDASIPGKGMNIAIMVENYGALKAIITMCGVPYVMVHPMTWQSRLKLRVKGEVKNVRKRRYKLVAQDLYKDIRATMWSCDAILIMHFARIVLGNDLKWVKSNLPVKNIEGLF